MEPYMRHVNDAVPELSPNLIFKLGHYLRLKAAISVLIEETPEIVTFVGAVQSSDWQAACASGFVGCDCET